MRYFLHLYHSAGYSSTYIMTVKPDRITHIYVGALVTLFLIVVGTPYWIQGGLSFIPEERLEIIVLIRTYALCSKYAVVALRLMIAFCSYHDTCSFIRAVSSLTKAMKEAKMWVCWETARVA